MKKLNFIKEVLVVAMLAIVLNSCLKNNEELSDVQYSLDEYRISYATERPLSDGTVYFTLDNKATLWPAASIPGMHRPENPQRVQLNYTLLSDNFHGYDHAIKVNRIDTILTKIPMPDKGEKNDSVYGNSPVKILEMWIGDGFLNIIFQMEHSGQFKHAINLLRDTTDAASQYMLELRHNSFSDKSKYLQYGVVAFDLSAINTKGEEATLSIKVKTFEGVKEYKKKYVSGRDARLQSELKPQLKLDGNSLDYLE